MTYTKRMSFKEVDKYRCVMDPKLSMDYFSAHLLGQKYFEVGTDLIEIWEQNLIEYKKKEKDLHDTAKNNNKGIAYEKQGKTKQAISIYEKNIEIAYPARHSYDRLLILYRKAKEVDNEIRICELAINMFPNEPKYKDRLEKVQKLSK